MVRVLLLVCLSGLVAGVPRASADPKADAGKAFTAFVDGVAAKRPLPKSLEMFITPWHDEAPIPTDLADVQKLLDKPKVKLITFVPSPSGTSAWLYAEIPAKVTRNGKARAEAIRASAFMVADAGAWQVRATHWSLAMPNHVSDGCGALGYEWDLPPSVPKAIEARVKAVTDTLLPFNRAAFQALLSSDKRAFLLGSALKEKFTGRAIHTLFKKLDIHLYTSGVDTKPVRAGAAPDDQLMWIVLPIVGPEKYCTTYRALYVLAKEAASWRIVHQHYSENFF
jgi:hypothetical protein